MKKPLEEKRFFFLDFFFWIFFLFFFSFFLFLRPIEFFFLGDVSNFFQFCVKQDFFWRRVLLVATTLNCSERCTRRS